MMRRLALAALFLFVCGVRARAGNCSITPTSLNFGNYVGQAISMTATLQIKCTPGSVSYEIGLNAGTAPGATVTSRAMTSGGTSLGYGLYSDSAHMVNWGNSPGVDTVPKTSNGAWQTFYIYGLMPANEFAAPGTYTDAITVTVYESNSPVVTATITISATMGIACTIGASNLSFGAYSGATVKGSSTITVTCTNSVAYNVGLDAGTASGATVTTRRMVNGSNTLGYALYSNSGRTTNWGNTVGTDTVAGTGSGAAQSLTVYGQIPAGQRPTPGSYTDTITATITY